MTGPELRERRKALALTQTQLAARLGVPQATISRWETGVHQIDHPAILALAMEQLQAGAERR